MGYTIHAIDWDNPRAKISDNFTVHEATWLPSWRVYHTPSEKEKQNIVDMARVMQKIRDKVKTPIIIHCWIRPNVAWCPNSEWHGQDYNAYVGSKAKRSPHIYGKAVDFHVAGFSGPAGCNTIRRTILPFLEEWGARMEDINGSWIHVDIAKVKYKRFFKP